MKTTSTWNLKSIVGKIMIGFFLVAMIGSIDVTPVLGRNDHNNRMTNDNNDRDMDRQKYNHYDKSHGRYYNDKNGKRHYQRNHYLYDKRHGWYYNDNHGKRHYRAYGYKERVYIPPPVIYEPPPPTGIRIFFPPLFFHVD
ncbi:MAG: hypothetical protein HQK77_07115 [Desulfobacterales bacterium]|nr:hypothetical protein [Desulfobacterales bacterium]